MIEKLHNKGSDNRNDCEGNQWQIIYIVTTKSQSMNKLSSLLFKFNENEYSISKESTNVSFSVGNIMLYFLNFSIEAIFNNISNFP